MLVFGGRGTTTGAPSDSFLWSLNFSADYNSATWEKLSAAGPSPRFHSALDYDSAGVYPYRAYLFGGEIAGGQKVNDLWRLNVSTLTWTNLTDSLAGARPSPRSRHTVTQTGSLLHVFGGKTADDTVYVAHLDVTHPDELRTWTTFRRHAPALSGHTAVFWPGALFERRQEIFDPTQTAGQNQQWTLASSAPRFQNWYPQTFVWKPDTVFDAGPDELTYKYSISSPAWAQYPSASSGFRGGSAVMYRPGKVMKCGSRDIDTTPSAVGTTKRVHLNAGTAARWDTSATRMLPRVNHNLVLLPNGKVLVVGGASNMSGSPVAEKRPEIWDPDNSGGIGAWFGRDTLAAQLRLRDYHSTALLLPDARVLSGGGNSPTQKDLEIFCPPYLFKSDGSLATRPPLSGSPQRVRYGAQFSVCLSSSDSISKVCLIRPAATTHGQDENQRYVPVTFTPVDFGTSRLTVTAPPDSFEAPPGDYLLFLVNKKGVPSVARWVRMGYSWSEGDNTRPARITDLTRDMVTNNAISLYWTAVGDDGNSGTASYADLRRSTSPIDSSSFSSATAVNPQPVPVCSGTTQVQVVTGLSPHTTYYFAVKFSDESGNVSLISNVVSGTTLGQCCEGERATLAREGGTSARRAGSAEGAGGTTASAGATSSAATAAGGTPLVVEATTQESGLDLRLLAIGGESFEGHALSDGGGVLLQRADGGGRWSTLAQYDLPPGDRIALPAPDQTTRWVLLEPLALEKVLPEVSGSTAGWILDQARHSREGDVEDALSAYGATPGMSAGDTLTAHYAAAPASAAAAPAWLLVVDRPASGAGSTRAGGRRPDPGTGLPKVFALRQNLPNPFAATTTIRFALPVASRVRLEVFDLLGRRVHTLASAFYPPGEHEVEWNRRTTNGALASPGLYFYRMDAGQYREKKRMVILP
jgi:hypothetical protein